jgi:hypothetical protein
VKPLRPIAFHLTGKANGESPTKGVRRRRLRAVNSANAYDPRGKNQITGFTLKEFGATTTTGEVPEVGGACQGGGAGGTWSSVTQTGSSGGLFVHYSGLPSVQLQ